MIVLYLFWLACFLYIFYIWKKISTRNGDNEPPMMPGAIPIVGHTHLLVGDSCHLWNTVKDLSYDCLKAGGVISAYIGPRTIYVVTDADDCLTVANTCLEKDAFYHFAKPWLGEGLVTGKLSLWKTHRRLLNPAFSQVVLDGFLDVFNRQSRRLVNELAERVGKAPFDHWVYTRHNALETICMTALGVDFDDTHLLNKEYVVATEEMFNILVERFQCLWMHNDYLYSLTKLKKRQDVCLKILHSVSDTVLQKRKREIQNNNNSSVDNAEKQFGKGSKFKPFIDLLLDLKGAFTDQELREHVDTMIVGGHDTSAAVLMYTMLLIGSHPEVQDKVVAEMQEIFGGSDRDVDKYDLSRMIYLEAVLKESMRIYPIVPVAARYLDRDVKLRNCTLARRRTCFMFLYGIHRHPMWGPDAELFIPERWLDPKRLPDNPNWFAAFNVGRRNCIGKSYALMSMKTTLSHIIRNYKIKGDHSKLIIKIDVMLKPVSGHHITIERRTDENNNKA